MGLFWFLASLLWVVVGGLIVAMWLLGRASRRLSQKIGNRLQQRAFVELELIDRVELVVEDLIRVEPERAGMLEITRLDLGDYRRELEDDLVLFTAMTTATIEDLKQSSRRNHRNAEGDTR